MVRGRESLSCRAPIRPAGFVAFSSMSNEISAAALEQPATESTARQYLDQIMARIGVDGLLEALASPGLLARVDQHAAAVRNSIESAGKEVDPISLSGYARSVLAVHERHGRPLPTPATVAWPNPDWTVLRLVAVCSLADAENCL